ncbi:hypothetical protein TPHA_0A04540 [Tetrapisispora phaffii CBS 4417]|uniref:Zn(2)-C6 fungal-type domain-containing protein n=1 Tax=Tetrapisispora phaffii (strain ATCC 24235 / CBS 4417 / NBRC 1672 / NRRL Y-8282 / UCD 70-5) TaxID=1071381 RepID=G8BNP9_TETPH|nr:hypothetical protein TPHA_0A04540 [Tetrapisispora phaffii CBS 4417]CCE61527.1 hypothetical protein TPHA_0A04540 [Tetrapisispora phaffii CBS 4417]
MESYRGPQDGHIPNNVDANGQIPIAMDSNGTYSQPFNVNNMYAEEPVPNYTPQQQQQQQHAYSNIQLSSTLSTASNKFEDPHSSAPSTSSILSSSTTSKPTNINPTVLQTYTNANFNQFTSTQFTKQIKQQMRLLPNQTYRQQFYQAEQNTTNNNNNNNNNVINYLTNTPSTSNYVNENKLPYLANSKLLLKSQSQSQPQSQSNNNAFISVESRNDSASSKSVSPLESIPLQKNDLKPYDNPRSAKKRVSRACDHCRKRKIKCDEKRDPNTNKCSNCIKYNSECTFKNWEQNDAIAAANSIQRSTIKQEPHGVHKIKKNTKVEDISPVSYSSPDTTSKSSVSKIERIEKKVSLLSEHIGRIEDLLIKISEQNSKNNDRKDGSNEIQEEVLAKTSHDLSQFKKEGKYGLKENYTLKSNSSKLYSTSLLTTQKLMWMIYTLSRGRKIKESKAEEIIKPIKDMLSISLKWYVLQSKKLMDFSSPFTVDNKSCLSPLPPKEQCKRLLENFRATALSHIASIIGLDECLEIADKYYNTPEGRHKLSYSELLLLNICICSGASITQMMKTSDYYLRKDKFNPNKTELKIIESNCLLNSMYYYNKVTILNEGIKTLQALLLLSSYLQTNVNIEVALAVLETAIRYVIKMGLNKQSYYDNIYIEDVMTARSILWRCYSKDKSFALMLNKPPLLRPTDFDISPKTTYLNVIKELIGRKGSQRDMEEMSNIDNVEDALNFIIRYSEYVPLFISYYATMLTEIETSIYLECFSVDSFANKGFGQNLETILKLRSSLIDWEDGLHPCISVKSYKQCLSALYVQTFDGNPALYFEVACFRVLGCHFHYYYLRVMLGLLGTSYLINNEDLLLESNYDILALYNLFRNDSLQCSIRMLELFQTFDYQPYVNDEIAYYFLTGVYVILFYIVEHSGDRTNDKVLQLINLFEVTHAHIIGENQESLTSDNMKWNVGLFFYTYILQQLLKYFEIKDNMDNILDVDITPYSNMLLKILDNSNAMKNHVADELYNLMKKSNSSPYGDIQDFSKDILSDENELGEEMVTPSITLFRELEVSSLIALKSDSPLLSIPYHQSSPATPGAVIRDKKELFKNDHSLYTVEPKSFTNMIYSLSSLPFESQGFSDLDINNFIDEEMFQQLFQVEFTDPFWRNELFYDREFFFSEAIISRSNQSRNL